MRGKGFRNRNTPHSNAFWIEVRCPIHRRSEPGFGSWPTGGWWRS